MTKFTIELGITVESKISGFKGVVTSRSEHLNGCNRYWIAPKVGEDGKLPEGNWLDEDELVAVISKKIEHGNNERGGFPSKIK